MRKFLRLSYNGARFHGWQSQPNASSVQQTLEEALSTLLRKKVSVVGAGRTDTGVNARMMIVHFDIEENIVEPRRFLISLNKLCGPDIAVQSIADVAPDAHARFDAVSRTYKYFVTYEKCPFLNSFAWHSPSRLNIESMNEACRILLKTDDFTSFAKLHSDAKTNLCDVSEARWEEWHNEYGVPGLVFTISANRFLRNMVRAVVGTLADVGRGKLTIGDFSDIIEKKDRCSAGTSMPAHALFLWEIDYPENLIRDEIWI